VSGSRGITEADGHRCVLSHPGSALTFSQMLFITVQLLPTFLSFPTPFGLPRLRPRQIPLSEWGSQVVLLTFGALLNNWAYAYRVPLTVQIVFRSAGNFPSMCFTSCMEITTCRLGLPVSMIFGYIFLRKRYSIVQVVSRLHESSRHTILVAPQRYPSSSFH
jgi:UDP-xylose/UDP-N-acetylglucosamine transporter B4